MLVLSSSAWSFLLAHASRWYCHLTLPLSFDAVELEGRRALIRLHPIAHALRRLTAKPEKIIVDVLSGEPQFVKHTLHADADGLVMPVEWGWILCSARPSESLRSGVTA